MTFSWQQCFSLVPFFFVAYMVICSVSQMSHLEILMAEIVLAVAHHEDMTLTGCNNTISKSHVKLAHRMANGLQRATRPSARSMEDVEER